MIVIAGPRQVGKTTMVQQALSAYPSTFVATDSPLPDITDPFSTHKGDTVVAREFRQFWRPVSDSRPVEMSWKSPVQDRMSCSRLVWFDRSGGSKGHLTR